MEKLAQRVDAMVKQMFTDFLSGDLRNLASHYDYPLAMHLEGGFAIVRRREDMMEYHALVIGICRKEGLTSIAGGVVAMELPRNQRFRVWVNSSHCDETGKAFRQSDRILYCRDHGDRIAVEMLSIKKFAFSPPTHWPQLGVAH